MKNIKIILTLGIIVAILPYTGFPTAFKAYLLLILGISISLLAFRIVLKERNNTQHISEGIGGDTSEGSDSFDSIQSTDEENQYQSASSVHE